MMKTNEPIFVMSAIRLDGYKLQIRFSDGKETVVDFESFLNSSTNPHIRKYLDNERFDGFEVTEGDLHWNDYDLCFPVEDLYENKNIERKNQNAA